MSDPALYYPLLAGGQTLGLIVLIVVGLMVVGGAIDWWRHR